MPENVPLYSLPNAAFSPWKPTIMSVAPAAESPQIAPAQPDVQDLKTPGGWMAHMLGDYHLRLCAFITLVVALMPPDGIPGLDLCWFHNLAGLPCPGCGITRSGSNILRGNVVQAARYHLLGPVLMPLIFALGALAFAPRPWRAWLRGRGQNWSVKLRKFWLVFIALFVIYGSARTLLVFLGWVEFPTPWP